jgi:hypothetical protein
MRWGDLRRSGNVQSRGGMGGLALGGGGIGALLIAGIVYLLGGDPSVVMNQVQGSGVGGQQAEAVAESDPRLDFSARVLGSTEDVWSEIFREQGGQYRPTTLVSYVGGTQTACGAGQAAMGPFYCPADHSVYLDLTFFEQLRQLGGGGDFAQAYVVAHEVGHHIQTLTGATEQARRMGAQGEESGSVRLELQADCYSGVWAARANARNIQANGRPLIEPGDLEEGLRTASAIGDDALQSQSGRGVSPESFTHGSAAQRARWLRRGLESGDPKACDTFSARSL